MTTKFNQVLEFIGTHNGVTTTEVQKFIVEKLQKRTWDAKRRCGMWNITLYTDLFPNYCQKVGGVWFLKDVYAKELSQKFGSGSARQPVYKAPTDWDNVKPDRLSTGQELVMKPLPSPALVKLHPALADIEQLQALDTQIRVVEAEHQQVRQKLVELGKKRGEVAQRIRDLLEI